MYSSDSVRHCLLPRELLVDRIYAHLLLSARKHGQSMQLSVSVRPNCVAEPESYDRLYWRLPLALVCPRHGQVLRHRCPDCQHPIKSLRAHAYRCGFCSQGDYWKDVARALGPSSALLDAMGQAHAATWGHSAFRWKLQERRLLASFVREG